MWDPVRWKPNSETCPLPGKLRLIDQTLIPGELTYLELDDIESVFEAIKMLRVRGAPAIGIAAAFGLVVGVQHCAFDSINAFLVALGGHKEYLASSRPTAVNLFWALSRCFDVITKASRESGASVDGLKLRLHQEAQAILEEDIQMCRKIGEHGATLFTRNGMTAMTHCNAGALATGDWGTALSAIYVANEQGKQPKVFSTETRPLQQGSRLTAFELHAGNVDVTSICDSMAAHVMREKGVDLILVGADRITANGDTANKIGTYGLAVLAKHHGIPFYICAPRSTFDPSLPSGDCIPIEQRNPEEIRRCAMCQGLRAPEGVQIYNPAFDVTPSELIAGIVTEEGILRAPYTESIRQLFAQ
eukprot:gnl/Trimastix_PCT/2405.p1 GENE.gnl/Trimastix_PCT/2405~~gnl/Trimastix_PCT/2405.p1  ORF type:complete len:360 (-),score=93.09 gnl/Trimastix_PCT/2405:26-1105(-)